MSVLPLQAYFPMALSSLEVGMGFLDKLLKCNEVKQTLLVVDTLPKKDIHLSEGLISEIQDVLVNNPDRVKEGMSGGATAEDVVYHILLNMIDRELCTGQYHVYRGTLGMEGQDLLNYSNTCVVRFVKQGHWTEEQATEYRSNLREGISQVG